MDRAGYDYATVYAMSAGPIREMTDDKIIDELRQSDLAEVPYWEAMIDEIERRLGTRNGNTIKAQG